MTTALENYHARMRRVLEHIDRHLDGDLGLETLSRVAAFSKFHFHRQFTASFGLSVHRYVQLARLQRAAGQLASDGARSVTEIAMDAGYDAPDAFARAFRQRFGQSPSSFRKSPDWGAWLAAFGPLDKARTKLMQIIFEPADVEIREVPPIPVALVEHRGDRTAIPQTRQLFLDWCQAAGLPPESGRPSFMVFRSERAPATPADYAMDLCVGTDRPIEPNAAGIKAGTIPGGRCAVLRYPGNSNNLEPGGLYLYRDWLPASGEETGDFPLYCKRRFAAIPGTGGHEVVVELFLPLK
ncbi:MAG: AraC family transcriptional regulator [Pelagibacterium sp. SCN 64-44]|nr:MAG: AraC family transcriptional regulator [Pelagibacterium sp. SCN 64-44]